MTESSENNVGTASSPATASAASQRTIAVVDGNSLMHRAFHAIPPTMTAPDGRPINALFGFTSMFVKMVETLEPDGVICCFDKGKPRVRMEMLPQYKAQRPPMDPSLHEQFPMVKDLLRALDVPVVELEGWEGDDLLGTLAKQGETAGFEMLLVTGDRDMYQLSTENIKIIGTRKGLSDVAVMDPASVEDLYHGITPALVPDFYGLKGDSSDNIPGVPGIGPKKAAALITEYGDLDAVIAHADEVKGKMGENLRAHVDDALLSRKVATIRCDAPIDFDLASARFPTFDPTEVRAAFSGLGFTSLTARVLKLDDRTPDAGGPAPAGAVEIGDVLEGKAALTAVESAGKAGEWLGTAAEEDENAGTLFDDGGFELWVSCEAGLAHLVGEDAGKTLVRALKEWNVAAADVKALIHSVIPVDSSKPAQLDVASLDPTRLFDVSVAAYLLDSSNGTYTYDALAERFGAILPEATDAVPAEALSAVCARSLRGVLAAKLDADGSKECFDTIEMPLVPVLVRMERLGMYVDPAILAEQSAELGADVEASADKIHAEAGEPFNIDSPQQLSHVLFDVLGLPTAGLKKTKKGFYSTNAKVLSELAATYPIVAEVLDYREKTKIKSTYLDALPQLIVGDHRVHTTLNQTVAATGRLSSSNPNLQNIPVRSELGRRVRKAFTVPAGYVFLACDYSQIELRLLAHLSGDEHLIAAFCEGADFHAATAARVFGIPVDEVTPALRSRAKAVNFGIVYGQQAFGLSQSLHIPRSEAQQMIDRYFEAYPGVRSYLDRTVADAKATGYATTMYGRKRRVPDIHAKNPAVRAFGERTAMNHPMQGSAADIIKIAMAEVEHALNDEGLKSRLILQIHDELDLEVPEAEITSVSKLVESTMEGVVELKVPLEAEVSYGPTWADAK